MTSVTTDTPVDEPVPADLRRDLWTGGLFILSGGSFAAVAATYPTGTAISMGPGWFPLVLGLLLTALGVSVALPALWRLYSRKHPSPVGQLLDDDGAVIWRPIAAVMLALLGFAILLPVAGLVIATFTLVLTGAAAGQSLRWREAASLAAGLSAVVAVLFVGVLGIPLDLLPASLFLL